MKGARARKWILISACFAVVLSAAVALSAQSLPPERTFHASKAAVQKALQSIPAYPGGKLPTVAGFASPSGQLLDSFKRGHYDYDVLLKTNSAGDTVVRVTAKITAWSAGSSPANSGYRVLKSSGRLESDLLDALGEKLNPQSTGKPSSGIETANAQAERLPDSPSVGTSASLFSTPRVTTAPSSVTPARPPKVTDPATAKRLEALMKQEQSLEQILHNQVRPDDLAIVKRSNTSVVAEPQDKAAALFQADAEDEFEVLDSTSEWVHIKISDLSRGWIKREYVDLPGAATFSLFTLAGDSHESDLVRRTKEQVAMFPGKWEPLDGKQVKIIWVQPHDQNSFGSSSKWGAAKVVFSSADAGSPNDAVQVAGVVVIFDAEDGGMTASTLADLQQWRAGHLSDEAFWKRCWREPAEAFQAPR